MPENSKLSALGARLLSDAENISEEMQDWRRDFHQFPELAFEENITASKIIKVLESIEGMEVVSGFAIPTAVIGILRSDLPGPARMLRSCMDAIAVEEETGLPFSSCMPGLMHGCGHDAHMASLLGAAKVLSLHRDKLKKRVVLLFQPAGEGRGGARTLVENRFLETFNIGSAASLHWWSELPYGELFLRRESSRPFRQDTHRYQRHCRPRRRTPHDSRSGNYRIAHRDSDTDHAYQRDRSKRTGRRIFRPHRSRFRL